MIRFLVLTFILPFTLLAQTETTIISLDVTAALNERSSEITGHLLADVRMHDSVTTQYSFLVPKEMKITSLRNRNNDSYDDERSESTHPNFDLITLDLTDMERRTDTLWLDIQFSLQLDSSSTGSMFLNQKQFLLQYDSSQSWLPLLGTLTAERVFLELNVAPHFTVAGEEPFDTVSTETSLTWKRRASQPVLLSSAFTLCGISHAVKQVSFSSDSLVTISLYSSPVNFHQQYAAAIVRQLNDAARFFSTLTKQSSRTTITYAVVGSGTLPRTIFSTKNFTMLRNSPAYALFDSAAITRTSYNHWLIQTAQRFCPETTDSTAVFIDGFASYLAMRFLRSTHSRLEQQERFSAISTALTFFPAGTIAGGRTSTPMLNEILSSKGRYFFLMLEYLLGTESMDSVIAAMSGRQSGPLITFRDMQTLCEEQYGSSLDWFFIQWLNRSTAPEFIIQWKNEITPRGMSIVKTVIEQRGDLFSMPVPLVFSFGGRTVTKRIVVSQAQQEFTFTFPSKPDAVELDPNYSILRWLLEIRIPAHAKTSHQFLSISRDIFNAEREALYTLQLDPNNSTGSAPLAYFVLGNISALGGHNEQAKEYFMKAASSFATEETDPYKLLSLVRYGNIEEIVGKREDAVAIYQRAVAVGMNNPMVFEQGIMEAERYLREPFVPRDNVWYDLQ